jgi:hypothetical protein
MTDYHPLVEQLPVPTVRQTRQFADHVAGAHSWYKKLPLWPPGHRFVFYLDPHAGRSFTYKSRHAEPYRGGPDQGVERVLGAGEYRGLGMEGPVRLLVKDFVENDPDLFHYNQMPTAHYRERFGYWNYSVLKERAGPVSVYDASLAEVAVPRAWLDACGCELTACVHEFGHPFRFDDPYSLASLAEQEALRPGDETLKRFRAYAERARLAHDRVEAERLGASCVSAERARLLHKLLEALLGARAYALTLSGVTEPAFVWRAEGAWSRPAADVLDRVASDTPRPGVWIRWGDRNVQVLHAAGPSLWERHEPAGEAPPSPWISGENVALVRDPNSGALEVQVRCGDGGKVKILGARVEEGEARWGEEVAALFPGAAESRSPSRAR